MIAHGKNANSDELGKKAKSYGRTQYDDDDKLSPQTLQHSAVILLKVPLRSFEALVLASFKFVEEEDIQRDLRSHGSHLILFFIRSIFLLHGN